MSGSLAAGCRCTMTANVTVAIPIAIGTKFAPELQLGSDMSIGSYLSPAAGPGFFSQHNLSRLVGSRKPYVSIPRFGAACCTTLFAKIFVLSIHFFVGS